MKIKVQDLVKNYLTKYENTRDCDPYLLYYVWQFELNDVSSDSDYPIDIDNINLVTFLRLWKDKKYHILVLL